MPVIELGDGMLDLDMRIGFDEIKVAFSIRDEFDRARVGVIGRLDQPDRGGSQIARRGFVAQNRAGAFLDQFRWPTLVVQSRSQRCTALP